MLTLIYYPLCPKSRAIRLLLAECKIDVSLEEEKPWEWRAEFLRTNPSGHLPVLLVQDGPTLCGAYAISEYVSDTRQDIYDQPRYFVPFPGEAKERAEIRRIVDWFHVKFSEEVSGPIFDEKISRKFAVGEPAEPDIAILRVGFKNLHYHMSYVEHLASRRSWLAGDELSYADLAAAGHLSFLDYLNDIPWTDYPETKAWYARIKSRASYRTLTEDHVPWIRPPAHFTDPDF